MTTPTTPAAETLTTEMVRALREEAIKAGDHQMAELCSETICYSTSPVRYQHVARLICAVINDARAQDDEGDFVRVVP